MERNKPYYIAVDSDIIRALAFADILINSDHYVDFRKVSDPHIRNYSGYLKKMLRYMHEDKLRIVILNSVYQENKHSPALVNFIIENCYVPSITFENYNKVAQTVQKLAKKYCEPYFDKKSGTYLEPPMIASFDANVQAVAPTNDSYHMAEATLAGVSFVTINGKHFVFNEKEEDKTHNLRSKGIQQINLNEGYYQECEDGRIIVPKPFRFSVFGPLLNCVENGSLYLSEVLEEDEMLPAKTIKDDILAGRYDARRL